MFALLLVITLYDPTLNKLRRSLGYVFFCKKMGQPWVDPSDQANLSNRDADYSGEACLALEI